MSFHAHILVFESETNPLVNKKIISSGNIW